MMPPRVSTTIFLSTSTATRLHVEAAVEWALTPGGATAKV